MEVIAVRVPTKVITQAGEIAREHGYSSRSELIREAIRDKIKRLKKGEGI